MDIPNPEGILRTLSCLSLSLSAPWSSLRSLHPRKRGQVRLGLQNNCKVGVLFAAPTTCVQPVIDSSELWGCKILIGVKVPRRLSGMLLEAGVTEGLVAASEDVSALLYAFVNSCRYIQPAKNFISAESFTKVCPALC